MHLPIIVTNAAAQTEAFLSTFIQKHPYLTGSLLGGYTLIRLMVKKDSMLIKILIVLILIRLQGERPWQ